MEQWLCLLGSGFPIQGSQVQTTGQIQGDLGFHVSEVDQISTRNEWRLNGEK